LKKGAQAQGIQRVARLKGIDAIVQELIVLNKNVACNELYRDTLSHHNGTIHSEYVIHRIEYVIHKLIINTHVCLDGNGIKLFFVLFVREPIQLDNMFHSFYNSCIAFVFHIIERKPNSKSANPATVSLVEHCLLN
jgi:hypothetical protein